MRVAVYRNLNRGCWSIKALEGDTKGRVIAHLDSVSLTNVTAKVSEKARQTVLLKRVRSVHAWLIGELDEKCIQFEGKKLRYNPYNTNGQFVDVESNMPVESASAMYFSADNNVFYK